METTSVSATAGSATFELILPQQSSDPVVEAYRRGDQLNEPLVEVLRVLLPDPGTVLDLGCHVGTFALAAAALGHRVIAVDAAQEHVELVRASAEANRFDTVTVVHAAVTDRAGAVSFEPLGLFGHLVHEGEEGIDVPGTTLPALLAAVECPADAVGFVKMDIEGCELPALRGATALLRSPDAPPILYESNPRTAAQLGYSTAELRTSLEQLGYRSYRPEPDGFRLCPPPEPQPEAWVDLVAVKPSEQRDRAVPLRKPMPRRRLMAKFDHWSRDPDSGVRAYVATELMHGQELRRNRKAKGILARLAEDQSPEVRNVAGGRQRRRPWHRLG